MPRKKPVHAKSSRTSPDKSPGKTEKNEHLNTEIPLMTRMEAFLVPRLDKVFWLSMALTLLTGLLMFDIRISLTVDDSAYIIRADDFIKHFTLPVTQGPLYPVILSPFVALFGISLLPLKLLSLVFLLAFTALTFHAFKGRIPAILLTGMMILASVNSGILYYASQTFSEACFMFFQGLTFLLFFRFFLDSPDEKPNGAFIRQHLILALSILGLGLTRSIGYAAGFAITGFFLIKGKWKNLAWFMVAFTLLLLAFQIFKLLIWGVSDVSFDLQLKSLYSKDYYNPTLGTETLTGFLHRFASNSNLFLSKHLWSILGLRSTDSYTLYPVVAVLTYLMILASGIIYLRKNVYIFFAALYLLVFILITFFIAHTIWGQSRFIIPLIPPAILIILSLPYAIVYLKANPLIQGILPVLLLLLLIMAIRTTIPAVVAARKITDKSSNLTPDWKNYCKLSELGAAQLPPEAVVACRKPSISFIYGHGRKHYGIMNLLSYPGGSILADWQKNQKPYYLISATSLNNTPVSKELYYAFKNGIVGYGISNDTNAFNVRFYVMDFPDSTRAGTLDALTRAGITPSSDYNSIKSMLGSQPSPISIIYPDSLLRLLMKAKVTHILTANLRAFADQKTSRTNNTVERFMTFIEFKYQAIRTKIMKSGEDDDEPTTLYQLNYEGYGLRIP